MEIEKIIRQPSKFYNKPEDILMTQNLNLEQKVKALMSWKQTCLQLQACTGEGMEGDTQVDDLSSVLQALRKLENSKEN